MADLKQYGQTLKLTGVDKEPITLTIANKKIRDSKKAEALDLISQYEETKAKKKKADLEKKLKAIFENTEVKREKEAEEAKAKAKVEKVKKAKEQAESAEKSTSELISALENKDKLSSSDMSKLEALLAKNKGKVVNKQRSGRGREW